MALLRQLSKVHFSLFDFINSQVSLFCHKKLSTLKLFRKAKKGSYPEIK